MYTQRHSACYAQQTINNIPCQDDIFPNPVLDSVHMSHFLVFGRHPWLSLAETRAILGDASRPICVEHAAILESTHWDGQLLQDTLGGCVKLGDIWAKISFQDLTAERVADEMLKRPRAERILFSCTVLSSSPPLKKRFSHLPIELKRALKSRGHASRWVTGDDGEVAPAAVQKLHLTSEGYDLMIILTAHDAYIGSTTHVQNADAWSLRDYGRPARDAANGMLPPKLARMMINLGRGKTPLHETTLLDPFCGGGTVLMEAALLGYDRLIGSDLESRQIEHTRRNLDWMVENHLLDPQRREGIQIFSQSARSIDRSLPAQSVDLIVTEGSLGAPLRGHEPTAFLVQQKQQLELLWRETLEACAVLQPNGGRVVCVWPVFAHIPYEINIDIRDALEDIGYRLIDPLSGWAQPHELVYSRPDQRVKRRIVILEKIR